VTDITIQTARRPMIFMTMFLMRKLPSRAIGCQAVVIGHSLGGCVAGVLAQSDHPNVAAALLEDPPCTWAIKKSGIGLLFPECFL
jgi:pimeloyl-ACP methyl ester carboxylesterase